MYGGLGVVFFLLVLYLQQVAGYDALQAGLATLPSTVVMFLLSKRFGGLADRHGPRLFMGLGPLVAALRARVADAHARRRRLPARRPARACCCSRSGLAATVAPLTAAVLADADEENAGIASGVNNAIARVASLMAIAAVGAVVASAFTSSIDASLAGVPLTPKAQSAVAQAKAQTFSQADTHGPAAARGRGRRERRAGRVGGGVPRRHGRSRRRSSRSAGCSAWSSSSIPRASCARRAAPAARSPGCRRSSPRCRTSGSRSRPESS